MAIFLALALLAQDPAVDLVEKLRSDELATREAAVRKLKELGAAAKPALEAAAKGADGAFAIQVRQLLERLRLLGLFTPALLEAMPGVVDRLAGGPERTWVDVFLEAENLRQKSEPRRRSLPTLKKRDLEPLAPGAARAAKENDDRLNVLYALRARAIHSADDELLAYFEDADSSIRSRASWTLSRVAPPPRLRARLVEVMTNKNQDIRVFALAGIASWDIFDAKGEVEKALLDPEASVRAKAVETLEDLAGPQSFVVLAPMLEDSSPEVRKAAVWAIVHSGAPGASKAVVSRFGDPNSLVVEAALQAAGSTGDRSLIPRLVSFLESDEKGLRRCALLGLAELGSADETGRVERLLRDEDSDVRASALHFLERHSPEAAARGAIEILKNPNLEDDGTSLRVIGRCGTPKDAPALLGVMADRTEQREGLAILLGRFGNVESIPALTALADKGSPEEIRESLIALARLGSKASLKLIEAKIGHESRLVRVGAAEALRGLGDRSGGKLLVPLLEDLDEDVRKAALVGVMRLLEGEAIPHLISRLRDLSSNVCVEALLGLIALEAWGATPEVIPLVDDADSDVRVVAASFLIASGASVDLESLFQEPWIPYIFLNALRSPDTWKRLTSTRFVGSKAKGGMTLQDLLGGILEGGGLKFEIRLSAQLSKLDRASRFWSNVDWEAERSLVVGLERHWYLPLVFDKDSVQILSFPEARRFWHSFWKEYKASRK